MTKKNMIKGGIVIAGLTVIFSAIFVLTSNGSFVKPEGISSGNGFEAGYSVKTVRFSDTSDKNIGLSQNAGGETSFIGTFAKKHLSLKDITDISFYGNTFRTSGHYSFPLDKLFHDLSSGNVSSNTGHFDNHGNTGVPSSLKGGAPYSPGLSGPGHSGSPDTPKDGDNPAVSPSNPDEGGSPDKDPTKTPPSLTVPTHNSPKKDEDPSGQPINPSDQPTGPTNDGPKEDSPPDTIVPILTDDPDKVGEPDPKDIIPDKIDEVNLDGTGEWNFGPICPCTSSGPRNPSSDQSAGPTENVNAVTPLDGNVNEVPEPKSLLLFLIGFITFFMVKRKKI